MRTILEEAKNGANARGRKRSAKFGIIQIFREKATRPQINTILPVAQVIRGPMPSMPTRDGNDWAAFVANTSDVLLHGNHVDIRG
jgi:hypothetical protein